MNAQAVIVPDPSGCDFDARLNASRQRALWRAVIEEQLRLAGLAHEVVRSSAFDIRAARRWFGSDDFETVCHLAGLEPDAVLRHVSAALADQGIRL